MIRVAFQTALRPFCLHLTAWQGYSRIHGEWVQWVRSFSVQTLLQEVCFSLRRSILHYSSKWIMGRSRTIQSVNLQNACSYLRTVNKTSWSNPGGGGVWVFQKPNKRESIDHERARVWTRIFNISCHNTTKKPGLKWLAQGKFRPRAKAAFAIFLYWRHGSFKVS